MSMGACLSVKPRYANTMHAGARRSRQVNHPNFEKVEKGLRRFSDALAACVENQNVRRCVSTSKVRLSLHRHSVAISHSAR